ITPLDLRHDCQDRARECAKGKGHGKGPRERATHRATTERGRARPVGRPPAPVEGLADVASLTTTHGLAPLKRKRAGEREDLLCRGSRLRASITKPIAS